MSNKELAKKYLSEENTQNKKFLVAKNSILPFDDSTKKFFIKIGFNTYVSKDNLDQIWRVEQIDGKNVIVAIDSGNMVTSDYNLSESNERINIYRGKSYIGFIPVHPYTDTKKVLSILNSEIPKFSFLPNELFVEAMKKEASHLISKFIDVNKLLKFSNKVIFTENFIYKVIFDDLLNLMHNYIDELVTIIETMKLSIYDINAAINELKIKLLEEENEVNRSNLTEKIESLNEDKENLPLYIKNITDNIDIINKMRSFLEAKSKLFETKNATIDSPEKFVIISDNILSIIEELFNKFKLITVELPSIKINTKSFKEMILNRINRTILDLKAKIKSSEISTIIKEKKTEPKEKVTKQKVDKSDEETSIVGSIALMLKPPKLATLAIISIDPESTATIIKNNFMRLYNSFKSELKGISVENMENIIDNIIKEFIKDPQNYSFTVPKEWGDILEELFIPIFASSVSVITDQLNAYINLMDPNPLNLCVNQLGEDKTEELLNTIKADGSENLILSVIKENKQIFFKLGKVDQVIQKLAQNPNIKSSFPSLNYVFTSLMPSLNNIFNKIRITFNNHLVSSKLFSLGPNIDPSVEKEIIEVRDNVLKFIGINNPNLDNIEKTHIENIVNGMIGFTNSNRYFVNILEGLVRLNMKRESDAMVEPDPKRKEDLTKEYLVSSLLTQIYLTKYAHAVGTHFYYSVLGDKNGCDSVIDEILKLLYYRRYVKPTGAKFKNYSKSELENLKLLKDEITRFLPKAYPRMREMYLIMLTAGALNYGNGITIEDILTNLDEYHKEFGRGREDVVFGKILKDMIDLDLESLRAIWDEEKLATNKINDVLKEFRKEADKLIAPGTEQQTLGKLLSIDLNKPAAALINFLTNRLRIKDNLLYISCEVAQNKFDLIPIEEFQKNMAVYLSKDSVKSKIPYLIKGKNYIENKLNSSLTMILNNLLSLSISSTTEVSTPELMARTTKNLMETFETIKNRIKEADFFGNILLFENLVMSVSNRAFANRIPTDRETSDVLSQTHSQLASEYLSRFLGKFQPTGNPAQTLALTILNEILITDDEIYVLILDELDKDPHFKNIRKTIIDTLNGIMPKKFGSLLEILSPILDSFYNILSNKIDDKFFLNIIDKKLSYLSNPSNLKIATAHLPKYKQKERVEELETIAKEIAELHSDIVNNFKTKYGISVIASLRERFYKLFIYDLFHAVDIYKITYTYKHKHSPKDSFLNYLKGGNITKSNVNPHASLLKKLAEKERPRRLTYYTKVKKFNEALLGLLNSGLGLFELMDLYLPKKIVSVYNNKFIKLAKNFDKEQEKLLRDFLNKLKQLFGNISGIVAQAVNVDYMQTLNLQQQLESVLKLLFLPIPIDKLKNIKSFGVIPHLNIQKLFGRVINVDILSLKRVSTDTKRKLINLVNSILPEVIERLEKMINKPYYQSLGSSIIDKSQIDEIIAAADTEVHALNNELNSLLSEEAYLSKLLQEHLDSLNRIIDKTSPIYQSRKKSYETYLEKHKDIIRKLKNTKAERDDLVQRKINTQNFIKQLENIEKSNLTDDQKKELQKNLWITQSARTLLYIPVSSIDIKKKEKEEVSEGSVPIHNIVSYTSESMDLIYKFMEDELRISASKWSKFFYIINTLSHITVSFFNKAIERALLRGNKLITINNMDRVLLSPFLRTSGYNEYMRTVNGFAPDPINVSLIRSIRDTMLKPKVQSITLIDEKKFMDIYDAAAKRNLTYDQAVILLASLIFQKYIYFDTIEEVIYKGSELKELTYYLNNQMLSDLSRIVSDKVGHYVDLEKEGIEKYKDYLELYFLDLLSTKHTIERRRIPISPMDIATFIKKVILKSAVIKIPELPEETFSEVQDELPIIPNVGVSGGGTLKSTDPYRLYYYDLLDKAFKVAIKWISNFRGLSPIKERLDVIKAELKEAYDFPTSYDFAAIAVRQKFNLISEDYEKNPDWVDKYSAISESLVHKAMDELLYEQFTDPAKTEIHKAKAPYLVQLDHYAAEDMVEKFMTIDDYKKHKIKPNKEIISEFDLHILDTIFKEILEDSVKFIKDIKTSYMQLVYNTIMDGTYDAIAKLFTQYVEDYILPYLLYITKSNKNGFNMLSSSHFVDSRCQPCSFIITKIMLLISGIYSHMLKSKKPVNVDAFIDYICTRVLPNAMTRASFINKISPALSANIINIVRDLITIGVKIALPKFKDLPLFKEYKDLLFSSVSKGTSIVEYRKFGLYNLYKTSELNISNLMDKYIAQIEPSNDVLLDMINAYVNFLKELAPIINKEIEDFIEGYAEVLERKNSIIEELINKAKNKFKNLIMEAK